jgi:transcriptional regulator with XRE-family HTH domain
MANVKRRRGTSKKPAATTDRNFRTFLLVSQLEGHAIGARIAQARKEAGMTQEDVADLAEGFGKRSLQDYEAGNTMQYKHLRELSSILNRPVEWFLHGDRETDRKGPLEEVAASVTELTLSMAESLERLAEILERLARIEGALGPGEVPGTGDPHA